MQVDTGTVEEAPAAVAMLLYPSRNPSRWQSRAPSRGERPPNKSHAASFAPSRMVTRQSSFDALGYSGFAFGPYDGYQEAAPPQRQAQARRPRVQLVRASSQAHLTAAV